MVKSLSMQQDVQRTKTRLALRCNRILVGSQRLEEHLFNALDLSGGRIEIDEWLHHTISPIGNTILSPICQEDSVEKSHVAGPHPVL